MKINGKSLFKKIALALAGVAALTGIGFGVKAIVDYTKEDLKTISPSFEVGNLGSDGKYVDDESTLYTKEAFACDGLQIKLDFDNQINYQIFYYDDLDNFIESTEVLSDAYSGGAHDSYARLVITPTDDEDDKISWTEQISYPKQMTVKVSKTQSGVYRNFYSYRLREVDNMSLVRFQFGKVNYENNNFTFVNSVDNRYGVTSKDIISVSAYKTLTSSFNKLSYGSSSDCTVSLRVYEFKYIDNTFKFLKSSDNVTGTFTFDKSTTHIILYFSLWDGSNNLQFGEDFLALVNSYLILGNK